MAFRNDIRIDWTISPRIVEIASPSTTVTVQDLYDTIRVLEERPGGEGLKEPLVVSVLGSETGGKQDLGGSISVGLTLTLIDAQIKFEDRPGPSTVRCFVNGGNVVRQGGTEPIAPSDFTFIVVNNQVGGVISDSTGATSVSGIR